LCGDEVSDFEDVDCEAVAVRRGEARPEETRGAGEADAG
jgi:hypothetical protein